MSTPAQPQKKPGMIGEYCGAALLIGAVGCILALAALGLVALWEWAV